MAIFWYQISYFWFSEFQVRGLHGRTYFRYGRKSRRTLMKYGQGTTLGMAVLGVGMAILLIVPSPYLFRENL